MLCDIQFGRSLAGEDDEPGELSVLQTQGGAKGEIRNPARRLGEVLQGDLILHLPGDDGKRIGFPGKLQIQQHRSEPIPQAAQKGFLRCGGLAGFGSRFHQRLRRR